MWEQGEVEKLLIKWEQEAVLIERVKGHRSTFPDSVVSRCVGKNFCRNCWAQKSWHDFCRIPEVLPQKDRVVSCRYRDLIICAVAYDVGYEFVMFFPRFVLGALLWLSSKCPQTVRTSQKCRRMVRIYFTHNFDLLLRLDMHPNSFCLSLRIIKWRRNSISTDIYQNSVLDAGNRITPVAGLNLLR